jgi:hypothetical protein
LFALLIDHDDAFTGVGNFGRGDETSKTAADHDYVRIIRHRVAPALDRIEARGSNHGQPQMVLACGFAAAANRQNLGLFQFGTLSVGSATGEQHSI